MFSSRWGFSWAVVRVGDGWALEGLSAPNEKGRLRTMSLLSRWRVSMDTARSTNLPSIDSCVPQALVYRPASLLRNLSACGVLDDAQHRPAEADRQLGHRCVSYKVELFMYIQSV